jgi:hypothetical protein
LLVATNGNLLLDSGGRLVAQSLTDFSELAAGSGPALPNSLYSVTTTTNFLGNRWLCSIGGTTQCNIRTQITPDRISSQNGGSQITATVTRDTKILITAGWQIGDDYLQIDDGATTTGNSGDAGEGVTRLGGSGGGIFSARQFFSEMIVRNAYTVSAALQENMNAFYSIY